MVEVVTQNVNDDKNLNEGVQLNDIYPTHS
jgi:hypothetical protein